MTYTPHQADGALRRLTRTTLTAAVAAAVAVPLTVATAGAASAASTPYRLTDPTVHIGSPCPTAYRKGVINLYTYRLAYRGDTAARCRYDIYDGPYYTGAVHTISKQY